MSFATFTPEGEGGLSVLSMRLVLPARGAWWGALEIDATSSEAPAEGARAELAFAGRVLSGYVRRAREWHGRTRIFFEAGANGMRASISPLQLESALVRVVARQIVTSAGEVVAGTAESPTDVLGNYHRASREKAGVALSHVLATIGLTWRFTDAGEVWWGVDTWEEVEAPGTDEIEPFGEHAETEVHTPDSAPFEPGQSYGGRQIERVTYTLSEDAPLDALLSFVRDGGDGLRGALSRAVRAVVPELPYLGRYPARVVRQVDDGRVELVPDDGAMVAGSPPIPVLYGLPGASCEVPEGARVGMVHEAADARRPRAMGWEQGTPASVIQLRTLERITLGTGLAQVGGAGATVELSGGGAAVTRVGDIASYLVWDPTAMTLYVASSLTSPYVPIATNPNTPNPPPTGTPGTPIILGAGSEKVSSG
ncbi:MAG: hypothetical protein EKK62_03185 [Acidimicrobiia bacterium]|nr:MAG: hypothetical protein EKK62_03185 [Acidimicrobiia bacterium]